MFRSIKRLFILVTCLMLLLSCASGSFADEQGMDTLPVKDMGGRVFRFGFSEVLDRDDYEDWLLQLEKDYNCQIEIVNAGDLGSVAVSIKGGTPVADVITMDDTYFYKFVRQALLIDLAELENIYPMDTRYYWKSTQEAATVDGKTYGVSCAPGDWRRILMYNKDIVNGDDDLQMLAEKGELTWEKLAEILQRVAMSGKAGLAGQMYESDILETFVVANGGRMFERDGLKFKCVYDSANSRNAIAFVQTLWNNGCLFENKGNWQYPQSQFAKGKAGVFIADAWNMEYIYSKAKFDIGMVLMPMGPDSETPGAGLIEQTVFNCYSIPITAENPEDVALVLSAFVKAQAEAGYGKESWRSTWGDIVDDEKNMKVLEAYAAAMEAGGCFQDYKAAVTMLYVDGIYELQQDATKAKMSPQAYLETVIPIYEAKAADFLTAE